MNGREGTRLSQRVSYLFEGQVGGVTQQAVQLAHGFLIEGRRIMSTGLWSGPPGTIVLSPPAPKRPVGRTVELRHFGLGAFLRQIGINGTLSYFACCYAHKKCIQEIHRSFQPKNALVY